MNNTEPSTSSETAAGQPWGRVDDALNVYVREGDSERLVGAFPDGTPEEALAYFERKYTELEGKVTLLEARVARGTADASAAESVENLRAQLEAPTAVGDIVSLRTRVDKLAGSTAELTEKQKAEREAARQEAIAKREELVAEAERLAAQPEQQIRWKDTSQAFEQLFTDWQNAQRGGPQIPKGQADALWKRFRTARQQFDSARRAHFAQLDAANKEVKQRKEQIIARAEALTPQGVSGIPAYRALLDEWKAAGRASRKVDDQLWSRFKAAGDVLYQAKAEEAALVDEEYAANLTRKEELLSEAEPILKETDHSAARKQLTAIQLRWDEIGRVPRESLRSVEGQLRKIESHVKGLEDEHWRATNPETKARSEGLRAQLESSIADLEAEIAAAQQTGDDRKSKEAQEKLATQQSWLAALSD